MWWRRVELGRPNCRDYLCSAWTGRADRGGTVLAVRISDWDCVGVGNVCHAMSNEDGAGPLPAETRARVLIDQQLTQAGWSVQDRTDLNLFASQGVAVREVMMKPGHGRVDYLLYVDQAVVGVIEAKPEGTPLSGVEWQSAMYAEGLPPEVRLAARHRDGRLPFVFEASGPRPTSPTASTPSRGHVESSTFPQPATLARILRTPSPTGAPDLARQGSRSAGPGRPAAAPSADRRDQWHREEPRRAALRPILVQMATGAGKTYTAVTESYRLLKYGGFNRILFLVDRNNLADQTLAEFQNYRTPDDGRQFTELYNVTKLPAPGDARTRRNVAISTIQRVYKALRDEEVGDSDDPEPRRLRARTPRSRSPTTPDMPPETFDLVIVDEAHRSIYGVWRGVLEYFDAHVVGLTATPGKQTFGFFRQNLVSEYTYPQSVADNVNVDFDVYRIKTQISEQGLDHRSGHRRAESGPPHASPALRGARRRPRLQAAAARPGRHRDRPDPHRAGDVPRPAVHRDLPGPLRRCPRL